MEVVKKFIEVGADVNIGENGGLTPLFLASQKGHFEIVEKLIEAGADVNAVNKDGCTPLYWASRNGHLDVVKKLLEAGAEVNICDKDVCTPLYWALQNGHLEIVEKLIEAGAIELNDDQKKEVERYKKLLKMGIPHNTVQHKMTMENTSKDVINMIFNNGSSASPENTALKKKKPTLMPIHWKKLSKEQVGQQSIWRSAKKSKIDAKNIELELEQLFHKKVAGKTQQPSNKDQKKENEMAQVLNMNRAQHVSISLQAYKHFSLDKLVAIINDLDPKNKI